LKFLVDNAADGHRTEAAFKIDQSVSKGTTPLTITETPYWVKKHREITAADWATPWSKAEATALPATAMLMPAPLKTAR
jgi:hypothetical protein